MDWFNITGEFHKRTFKHDGKLESLPEEWQRELAALWRVEADVNNGAYLQFIANWGRDSYRYASQVLKTIGASRMARIIDQCQAFVEEHLDPEGLKFEQLRALLPEEVVDRVYDLSYEFMDYPDDIAELGLRHYGPFIGR